MATAPASISGGISNSSKAIHQREALSFAKQIGEIHLYQSQVGLQREQKA